MHTRRIYLTPWCIQILYSDAWLRQHGNYDHLDCTISNNPGSKECGLAQIGNLLYEHWTAVSFWSRNQPNEDPNRAYEVVGQLFLRVGDRSFTPVLLLYWCQKPPHYKRNLVAAKKDGCPTSWEKKLCSIARNGELLPFFILFPPRSIWFWDHCPIRSWISKTLFLNACWSCQKFGVLRLSGIVFYNKR